MEVKSDHSVLFEAENDYDDDTFYAEIKRQILQLTSEDNEDIQESRGFSAVNVTKVGSNRSVYRFNGAALPARNFCLWETEWSDSPPVWLLNLWKNGKGTGVFIPQVTCNKKQRSSGRMNNSRRKIYKPVENKD